MDSYSASGPKDISGLSDNDREVLEHAVDQSP